jgi:parallel beta-helix repeat protein
MTGRSIARVGAAAVVLGLSLAGPHAGVAAADGPDADSGSASAGNPADQKSPPRPQRGPRGSRAGSVGADASDDRPAATVQGARTDVPAASSRRAAAPRPTRDAPTDDPGGSEHSDLPAPAAGVPATPRGAPAVAAVPAARRAADVPGAVEIRPSAASASAPGVAAVTEQTVVAAPRAAAAAGSTAAPVASAAAGPCSACWGAEAPTVGQTLGTVVNHLFNSTFDLLSTLPGGPISDLMTGALVLVRRSLFFVPEGVTASQTTSGLSISVNTGSTAYFRQDGASLQVSGDPRFWGAKNFALNADETVSVSNPGNAGCAGFVFTSGTAPVNLQTSQIDSIRFEGDSAFTGTVDSAVVGIPLSLRDAVRGLSGVAIDAAVVLGNDVEVDAGSGNAVFDGTVDASKKGNQSLTVTALGSTAFTAPVGGVTPLAGLTTQGIAPLTIAQSGDTKTIPLHFLPELTVSPPKVASPGVKYGIDVAIGDNPSQVYEFDTGGTGFFAGYNQPFWVNVPLTTTPAGEVYNSGNYFDGVVSNTKVTLGQGDRTVSTAQPIAIGAVLAGGNSKNGETFDFTNPLAPPVEGRFFGDFGASFGVRNGLTSPLVQLPGNLASGFLVQVGPIGIPPQLTVGITDDLRDQFPYAVPVIVSPTGGTYPTSGLTVLDQFGFAPTYSVERDGQIEYLGSQPPLNITCASSKPCLPTLIDSGAPTTGVRLGQDAVAYFATPNGKQLLPGTTFKATFPTTAGRSPLVWEFTAGDNSSVNEVSYEQTQKVGNPENVNAALTLYNYFDVMFDVASKTIYLRPTGAQADVELNSVTTTGNQTYRQNAQLDGTYTTEGGTFSVAGVTTLADDTSIDTGRGDVTFSGTVDSTVGGTSSLTVNSSGATNFVRVVGSQVLLDSLTTNAGGTTATAGVSTSGSQSYGDDVALSGLYSVGNGTFAVAASSTLVGSVAVSGGDIIFDGSIDSEPGRGFQLGLTPGDKKTANLNGAIGSTDPLGGLGLSAVDNGSAMVNVNDTLALQGNLGYSSEKGLGIGQGVTAAFTDGAVIQNFTGAGVIVDGAAPLTISGFLLSGNGKEGIQVHGSTSMTISGNVIVGNGTDGISVDGVSTLSISGNTITNNGADGVLVKDSTLVAVSDNTISGSGSDGIEVRKGQDNSILSNSITASIGNGIYLDEARSVTIVNNDISGNGTSAANKAGGTIHGNGIYADSAKDVSIITNTIVGNGVNGLAPESASTTIYANGIYADGTTNLTVTANTITGNGTNPQNSSNLTIFSNGVDIAGCTGVSLSGNTISGNGVLAGSGDKLTSHAAGVFSDNSSPVRITGNTISANGSDGVEVKTGDSNAILSNAIYGNGGRGISLSNGNADQPAPQVSSAVLGGNSDLVVSGTVDPLIGYMDDFELQVFYSPSTDAPNVQGRQLIYTRSGVAAGPFTYQIDAPSSVAAGGFITATVTPTSGAPNTSTFSGSTKITGDSAPV